MLRNTTVGYGWPAIAFHWTIAALFAAQVGLGLYMVRLADEDVAKFGLYQWHKSFGLLILTLAALRLAWRMANATPELPAEMSAWMAKAARLSHRLLYTALIVVPLSGWAFVSASPLGIPTYAFYLVVVPHLPVPVSETAEAVFGNIHRWLAWGAAIVALVHIAAALDHHFRLKDNVLSRMIRPARKAGG